METRWDKVTIFMLQAIGYQVKTRPGKNKQILKWNVYALFERAPREA